MPEAIASLKQPEALHETPKLSNVGEIFSIETPDKSPVTLMQVGEWRKHKMPDGKTVEIGDALAFPCSWEWLPTKLGIEEPSEAYTTIRLRLAKWLAPFFTLLTGATAVSGCINGLNSNGNTNDDSASIKQALTMDQLSGSVTLQEATFTQPGDAIPNIGTFDGEVIITFKGGSDGYCYHVRASDILTALQTQNVQKIYLPNESGLNEAGGGRGCIVYNNQIIYGNPPTLIADLVKTADGGLRGENQEILQPRLNRFDLTIAPADDNNNPLLLGTVVTGLGDRLNVHNLSTNEDVLHTENSTECGTPHRAAEGGAWVQGYYDSYGSGPVHCYIVRAETMDGLRSGWPMVRVFSADGGSPGDLRNPRIRGNVMVFEKQDEKLPRTSPRSLDAPKIYYVVFQNDGGQLPPDGGIEPDGGQVPDGGNNSDGGGTTMDGGSPTLDGGTTPDGGTARDGGAIPDGGAVPDGGNSPDGGQRPDGGNAPDGGTNPDGGNRPDGGNVLDGGPNRDGGPKPDGGGNLPDGGTPDTDGGGNRPDGGNSPDGGNPRADGGENRTDGGSAGPDGGDTEPDGSTGGPDGGENPDDGGADPDGSENRDAGLQPDGSVNGDSDYIGQSPGCSCNTSNNNPSNLASSVLLGIGLIGTRLRRVFKKKKNKK